MKFYIVKKYKMAKYVHSRCIDAMDGALSNWSLSDKTCNEINKYLLRDVEYAGVINFQKDRRGKMRDKNFTIIRGHADSVATPEKEFINFHTHPLAIYKSEGTQFGWPSSDDIREIIRYSLKGNIAHLVFTVEGTYVMQVNPGIVNVLKNIQHEYANQIRGIFCAIIEIYFKTTHVFRTFEALEDYPVTPIDFMKYINNFRISRILSKSKRKTAECGRLNCNGFPHWENGYEILNLEEVFESFGNQVDFIAIDENGDDRGRFRPDITQIKRALRFLRTEIESQQASFPYRQCMSEPCEQCHTEESTWPIQKIFNICLFYNDSYVNSRNELRFGKSIRDSIRKIKVKNSVSLWHPPLIKNCKL